MTRQVAQLRTRLSELGAKVNGAKIVLVRRVLAAELAARGLMGDTRRLARFCVVKSVVEQIRARKSH